MAKKVPAWRCNGGVISASERGRPVRDSVALLVIAESGYRAERRLGGGVELHGEFLLNGVRFPHLTLAAEMALMERRRAFRPHANRMAETVEEVEQWESERKWSGMGRRVEVREAVAGR